MNAPQPAMDAQQTTPAEPAPALNLSQGPVLPADPGEISIDAIIDAAMLPQSYPQPYWVSKNGIYRQEEVGPDNKARIKVHPDAFDIARVTRQGAHFVLDTSSVEHPDPFDLKNFLFTDKEKVERLLEDLERAAREAKGQNKLLLLVIGNGGTLAMSNVGGTLVSKLNVNELIELGGKSVEKNFKAVGFDLMGIDSSDYQWAFTGDATILLSHIVKHGSGDLRERLCIMCTNGTDTMVEGASNLKAQLGPEFPFPLGFTSANLTSEDDPSDVAVNVMSTASILKYAHKKGKRGVFAFSGGNNGSALNPFWAQKSADSHVNIFTTPFGEPYADMGHLLGTGWHDEFDKQYRDAIGAGSDTSYAPFILDGNPAKLGGVDLGNPAIVLDAQVGRAPIETLVAIAVARRLQKMGVILRTFGGFTFNNQHLSIIEKECRDRMLMIASSPFARGQTHEYETAKRIVKMGGVVTTMAPHTTMLKLMMANAIWPDDRDKMVRFIADHDIAGEQTRYNRDSYPYVGTPRELHQRHPVKAKAAA